jgi:hypothetical protein
MQQILLVDFENVPKVDLAAVPAGVVVPFFFGAAQKSVPTDFLRAALKLGERFVPIDIAGAGRNALDFHIAFYLGEYLTRNPAAHCVILSRDKGFDPLVKHLNARDYNVRRVATLEEAFPALPRQQLPVAARPRSGAGSAGKRAVVATVDNAVAWLATMDKGKRPKKRPALAAHLHSHFAGKLSAADIEQLVDRMIAERRLGEAGGKLSYQF